MEKLISVIIASYNPNIFFLKDAINSILEQTINDFEIIIIDDCSDNPIKERLNNIFLENTKIKIHRNEKNLERSASRNKGVSLAQGKYIAFLDDDDIWFSKNKLETQINFLEKHEEYSLCGTNGYYINDKKEIISVIKTHIFQDMDIRKKFLLYNPFILSSIIVKKSDFKKIGGFDVKINMAEDYKLFLKLGTIGKIIILNQNDIGYRIGNNSSLKNQMKIKIQCIKNTLTYGREYPNFFKTLFIWIILFILPYEIAQKINLIIPEKIKSLLYK